MGDDHNRKLETQVRALQLNVAGVLQLLGGDSDSRLRFWEVLKGITTPADYRLVSHQIDQLNAVMDQSRMTMQTLEIAAREIKS
jgi:hypothetical protein